ncbi:NADPH oxidase 4 [Entophlyctis luteolus]|nr:NADPH oxidase 4 [Entophlyctis luteolus]KAJ3379277.1 NADPH oxidase 4 [Entophlyctis sp. JEL0112]
MSLYSGLDGVMSTANTCTVSLASEVVNCGFNTAAEASAFCSTTTVATESCCSTVPTIAKTTATALATTAANAGSVAAASSNMAAMVASSSIAAAAASASSNSPGGLSIPVIAGAAGSVAALLIIVTIIFFCVRRRKRQNDSSQEKDFSNAYGNTNMTYTDKQPYSSQGTTMGYGSPPVNSTGGLHDHQMCEAVYDYTANLPDELTAVVGDKVILKIEYDDGWGFGYNTRTRKEGTFPLDILDKFQNGDQGYDGGNRTTRASSMYGPGRNNITNNNGANSYYGTNNATESLYYAQSEYNTNSIYVPGGGGGSTVREAAYDFTPEQPDEIELRVGDRVELKQQYDDGWALGRNLAINKEGLFPLDCLVGFDGLQLFDAQGKKKHNNRASSMYGTESQYGAQSMYGGNSSYYGGGTQSYYGTGNGQDSVYYGE